MKLGEIVNGQKLGKVILCCLTGVAAAISFFPDSSCSRKDGLSMRIPTYRYGFIDKTGREVITRKYDYAGRFSEGLAFVVENGKSGYIDKKGIMVLSLYDKVPFDLSNGIGGEFSEGLAPFCMDGRCGYIDKTGHFVIERQFESAEPFSEELALVSKEGNRGYIDKTGRLLIDLSAGGASDRNNRFVEGLARVAVRDKIGYIDRKGQIVIPPQFNEAMAFSEGLARLAVTDKEGQDRLAFIDKTGKIVIRTKFSIDGDLERNSTDFSEGLASLSEGMSPTVTNGKWFYINKEGKIVFTTNFDYAGQFSEGLACVNGNDKWGFINKEGKIVIPLQFDVMNIAGFSEGLASIATINLSQP